jgi:hypothetical protein
MSNIERSTLNLLILYSCLNNFNQTRDVLISGPTKTKQGENFKSQASKRHGFNLQNGFQKKFKGNPWSLL